jgi:hypothetical protein
MNLALDKLLPRALEGELDGADGPASVPRTPLSGCGRGAANGSLRSLLQSRVWRLWGGGYGYHPAYGYGGYQPYYGGAAALGAMASGGYGYHGYEE